MYPAIELGSGIEKFSFGAPRSVLDRGYFPERKFANSSSVDLELRTIEASLVGSLYLHSDDTIYGLRYDGTFGNTKVGASYHYIDATGGNADAFAIAVSHIFSGPSSMVDFMLYGGVEHLTLTSSDLTKYRIGAEGYWDRMTAGFSYSNWEDSSNLTFTTAYVDYMVLDDLTLTASLGHISSGSGMNIYGVGVQYDFLNKAYVKASILDTDSSGSDPFVEVMLGWEF